MFAMTDLNVGQRVLFAMTDGNVGQCVYAMTVGYVGPGIALGFFVSGTEM